MTTQSEKIKRCILFVFAILMGLDAQAGGELTRYVNPLLGTATLWNERDLQYVRHRKKRTWGAEVFPGSALPNAMVQLSPVTQFHSGAGYQYEDTLIYGFTHTNKGHWNLLHIPLLPATEGFTADNYASSFSHRRETAHPGYYQVVLDRYGINVELTSTLRCAYHHYTFPKGKPIRVIADMTRNNNRVRSWSLSQGGSNVLQGFQDGEGKMFFYAVANRTVEGIRQLQGEHHTISVVDFQDDGSGQPLELKIGFSFTSIANAKLNLEAEMLDKDFAQVRQEANDCWNQLLGKIEVQGGTERQKSLFYSCLYRSFLWPALRSDVNGDYTDAQGKIVNNGFRYYTNPSFWDDHRNKLILLGLLEPDVATDVIKTIIDKGEKQGGYMPTFFHGDHASTFIAGSWLRGIRGFDLQHAYKLLLHNAYVPGRGGRPYLDEYLKNGWIAEKDTLNVPYYDEYKAAVTKTLEYSYDDYATALIARQLGDSKHYKDLMRRSKNYRNVFDKSTGFYRGRVSSGHFVQQFDPYYPYFAYQFREANAWQELFYGPHDPEGVLKLYPNKRAVEQKLDSLFNEPWRGYEVENLTGFIGNYCHGNQPGHSQPYMYYFVDRQPKAQCVLDSIMNHYYDMGDDHLALAGMDDAGEMSAWYVFNASGMYTYSPADPEYIITVPLFNQVRWHLANGKIFTINREGNGPRITSITYGGKAIHGWFLSDRQMKQGKTLTVTAAPARPGDSPFHKSR